MHSTEILAQVAPTVQKLIIKDSRATFLFSVKMKSLVFPRLEFFKTSNDGRYHFLPAVNEPDITANWKSVFPNLKKKRYEETEQHEQTSIMETVLADPGHYLVVAHIHYGPYNKHISKELKKGCLVKRVESMFA